MIKKLGLKVIQMLESPDIPVSYIVGTFLGAITLRNLIELFNSKTSLEPWIYFHYNLSYFALACAFILVFYFAVREPVGKIVRVVLPSFILLQLAPVIDLIVSQGQGFDMTYFLPGVHHDLLLRYITFFGTVQPLAPTIGMRIEIAVMLVLSFTYIFLKTGKWYKGLIFTLMQYSVVFLYGCVLFFLTNAINLLHLAFWPPDKVVSSLYILITAILGVWIAYLGKTSQFKAFVKDIPWERIAHYLLMFVIGFVFAINMRGNSMLSTENLVDLILTPISILFACLFSMVTNNLADVKIDAVSNPGRSSVTKTITVENYRKLQLPLLAASLVTASGINLFTLLAVSAFVSSYYLYSMPPLRLKRIPFFSKIFISVNSLILVVCGFHVINPSVERFPVMIVMFFLFVFTFGIQFIDIKDYEGDKQAGVKTLPVLLGLGLSKKLIGVFFAVNFILAGIFLFRNWIMAVIATAVGVAEFFLINRKTYHEKAVFIVYLLSLLTVAVYAGIVPLKL